MSQENVQLVRGLYEAFGKGDVATVLGHMDQSIEWREAENFVYADRNPYIGPQAVLDGVFLRLGTEWDGFTVSPEELARCRQSRRRARDVQRNTQSYWAKSSSAVRSRLGRPRSKGRAVPAVHGYKAVRRCGRIKRTHRHPRLARKAAEKLTAPV
jgi:hypothetical protein